MYFIITLLINVVSIIVLGLVVHGLITPIDKYNVDFMVFWYIFVGVPFISLLLLLKVWLLKLKPSFKTIFHPVILPLFLILVFAVPLLNTDLKMIWEIGFGFVGLMLLMEIVLSITAFKDENSFDQ